MLLNYGDIIVSRLQLAILPLKHSLYHIYSDISIVKKLSNILLSGCNV